MVTTGAVYDDLGADHFTRRNPERPAPRLDQLQVLGYTVTLDKAS